jgi:hypothetical protein
MERISPTSTPRWTCSRDISLISGPRISSSAIGGAFRRTFLLTPPAQKCGNSYRRCAAAQVALIGAHDETLSIASSVRNDPNASQC